MDELTLSSGSCLPSNPMGCMVLSPCCCHSALNPASASLHVAVLVVLLQMLQYEITRKQLLEKQQKKIEALEARADELQKQKVEHEKQWAAAQRERELQKVSLIMATTGRCPGSTCN